MITREPELVHDEFPSLLTMQGRSKGDHVSELISKLCVALGHYDPPADRGGGPIPLTFLESVGPRARAIIELGCTFESALIMRRELDKPGGFIQPGELEFNGVFGTPDLLEINPMVMMEVKLTYMKLREARDEKHWRFWTQLAAYCKMLGVRVGALCVVFMEGDYKGSNWPLYREWKYEFEQEELDANWALIESMR